LSRSVKSVRVKIAGRGTIVETVADGMIAVDAMTVEIGVGAIALLHVLIVGAWRLSLPSHSLSRSFCLASRCRSIGVEKMVRPRLRLPKLLQPM
jgi:hypothetical protein